MTASAEDIWNGDLLDREKDARLLTDFLVSRVGERRKRGAVGAYVLNLNAEWGIGKTFFLERFNKQLKSEGYLSTYINCWKDDGSGEPLVAVMAAIEHALTPYLAAKSDALKLWESAKVCGARAIVALGKGAIKKVASKFVGDAVDEVVEIFQSDGSDARLLSPVAEADLIGDASVVSDKITELASKFIADEIDKYEQRLRSIEAFKGRLGALLASFEAGQEAKVPMFVLVDELDRCRPTYAIETLEQIKHLFDVDGLVFVVATDTGQLSHSIKAVYGEGFDGSRYLSRFFSRQFHFEEPELSKFAGYLFSSAGFDLGKLSTFPHKSAERLFAEAVAAYDITLRDAEQCFDILHSIVTTWSEPVQIELLYMLPLIIAFQQNDMEAFDGLARRDSRPQGPKRGWTVRTNDVRMPSGHKEHQMMQFITEMKSLSNQSLPSIVRSNRPGEMLSSWVWDRFTNEFQIRHRGQHQIGNEPYSIIREYPRRVTSLSRLTVTSR